MTDLDDKSILPVKYRDIRPIGSLVAIQNFDKHTALFSENGLQLTEFAIDSISAFKKGIAIIYQEFKQGLIDREGVIQLQPIYRELRVTGNGVEGKPTTIWKIITTDNKEQTPIDADESIADGTHYILNLAGNYGVAGEDLNKRIELKYDPYQIALPTIFR